MKTKARLFTAALGLPALRQAIGEHYRSCFALEVSDSRIAITSGASGGLLLTLALYVNPGDEILVPDPGYPGYRHMVRAACCSARRPIRPALSFQERNWRASRASSRRAAAC